MFLVIFEVLPNEAKRDDYLDSAEMLRPELEQVDGFVDNIRYKSLTREGWFLSLSSWRDEKSLVRWRTNKRHHDFQQKGRDEILSDYHMRVGQITADNQRPEGYALTEQRLDETEVGEGTAITLINATRPSEWKQTNNPYDCAEWLGTNQMIYPGEVNWMIAGRGVTHSERTSAATRAGKSSLFGIQTWVALPDHAEETDAQFEHHGKDALPLLEGEGKAVRLIQGTAWGAKAPVKTFTDMFYADVVLEPGAALPLPDNHEDRGLYITQGAIEVAGERFESGRMMVFRPGDAISVRAGDQGARLMLLGGETLSGPRYIWWNFVASSQEKIDAARDAESSGGLGMKILKALVRQLGGDLQLASNASSRGACVTVAWPGEA